MKAIYLCVILGFLISDSRQNNLERHIQCPCNKGLLINHGTPSAMKLKELISFLIEDSINMDSVKTFIKKTRFINDDKNTQNDENLDHTITGSNAEQRYGRFPTPGENYVIDLANSLESMAISNGYNSELL